MSAASGGDGSKSKGVQPLDADGGASWAGYAQQKNREKASAIRRGTVNKTHAIRDEARKLIAAGMLPRPREIIRILKEKKIEVSSAQVTMACKGAGLMLRDQRTKQKDALREDLPISAEAIGQVAIGDLFEAREFVLKMGSLDRAVASLAAFRRLAEGTDFPAALSRK